MNSEYTSTGLDHYLVDLWPHGVFDIQFDEKPDVEPVCIYGNPVGQRLLDSTPATGRAAREIFPTQVYQKISRLREGSELGSYDKITLEFDARWLLFQFLRTRIGVLVSVQDVTQAHLAELERDRLIARLQESNRELENFAYVASHDLREPARKITAFGERLATKYGHQLENEGRLYLDRMVQAASRMQALVDNLLSFSRLSRPDQESGPVDMERIRETVMSNLELQVAAAGARITWGRLPVIDAYQTQMEQLVQNLISNGLKFHIPGEIPRIEVRCEAGLRTGLPAQLRPGKSYVRLEFQDQGIGFEQSDAERIFNVLERLHGRSEYEGSGIGLAICKKIVENHQGCIYAQSEPGKGAIFVVWLPETQENL